MKDDKPIDSILISQMYSSHSAFVDLMLDALEKEVLTDDQ